MRPVWSGALAVSRVRFLVSELEMILTTALYSPLMHILVKPHQCTVSYPKTRVLSVRTNQESGGFVDRKKRNLADVT